MRAKLIGLFAICISCVNANTIVNNYYSNGEVTTQKISGCKDMSVETKSLKNGSTEVVTQKIDTDNGQIVNNFYADSKSTTTNRTTTRFYVEVCYESGRCEKEFVDSSRVFRNPENGRLYYYPLPY